MSRRDFFPGMQVWFHICKSIDVIHYRNKTDKNHRIVSIEAEKALDKIQHPFMTETFRKVGTEGAHIDTTESIYDKPTTNIHQKVPGLGRQHGQPAVSAAQPGRGSRAPGLRPLRVKLPPRERRPAAVQVSEAAAPRRWGQWMFSPARKPGQDVTLPLPSCDLVKDLTLVSPGCSSKTAHGKPRDNS